MTSWDDRVAEAIAEIQARRIVGSSLRPQTEGSGTLAFREPLFPEYADDPVRFFRRLGLEFLTDEQIRIAESVRDERETNVQAGISVGKSLIAAAIVIWWVYAVGGIAITTAPREKQVRQILWLEVRRLWDRNRFWLGGTRDQVQIKIDDELVAWGFTASAYSEEGFSGRHHPKLLAIEDEASGISQTADDGITANLTYHANRLLRIGNPLIDATPFSYACERKRIRIPVWGHPNVAWAYEKDDVGVYVLRDSARKAVVDSETGEIKARDLWPAKAARDASTVPGGPSIEFIEDRRREVRRGPGTTYWQTRFDGDFPASSADSIVPRSWFEAARARYDRDPRRWDEIALAHSWIHSLDVGDGVEPHALCSRRGPVVYALAEYPTIGDREDVARAQGYARIALETRPGEIVVDDIGVGSGVLAGLLETGELARGMRDAFFDSDRYITVRADMYWTFREELERGEIAIAPLGEEVEEAVRDELAQTHRAPPTSKGKVRLELKEVTSKRLGHSPNLADAIAMTSTRGSAYAGEIIEEGFVF